MPQSETGSQQPLVHTVWSTCLLCDPHEAHPASLNKWARQAVSAAKTSQHIPMHDLFSPEDTTCSPSRQRAPLQAAEGKTLWLLRKMPMPACPMAATACLLERSIKHPPASLMQAHLRMCHCHPSAQGWVNVMPTVYLAAPSDFCLMDACVAHHAATKAMKGNSCHLAC